jgi:membrane protein implicated in regulation of membrane protease activity
MAGFTLMGKMLILMGGVLLILGLIITFGYKIPWIGRLPGDIVIKKEHFSFYFPLTSCIIVSVILTLLFYLFRR